LIRSRKLMWWRLRIERARRQHSLIEVVVSEEIRPIRYYYGFASIQFLPTPTSTTRGTASSATDSISSRTAAVV
jgi:hypothetical protein